MARHFIVFHGYHGRSKKDHATPLHPYLGVRHSLLLAFQGWFLSTDQDTRMLPFSGGRGNGGERTREKWEEGQGKRDVFRF